MVGFLDAAAPLLHRLAVHTEAPAGLFGNDAATRMFAKMRNLRRLGLTIDDVGPEQLNALAKAAAGRLSALTLGACTAIEPPYLVRLVGHLQPALRSLIIETTSSAFNKPAAGGAQAPPRGWAWPRAERRALRGTCGLYGVELTLEGAAEPVGEELSSADEADPTSGAVLGGAGAITDEEDDGEALDDDLFVFDDQRRQWWEEERRRDQELLREAREKEAEAVSSADEFLAPTSEEDI